MYIYMFSVTIKNDTQLSTELAGRARGQASAVAWL